MICFTVTTHVQPVCVGWNATHCWLKCHTMVAEMPHLWLQCHTDPQACAWNCTGWKVEFRRAMLKRMFCGHSFVFVSRLVCSLGWVCKSTQCVWEKMEEPQIAERLFKLISEYAAPSVIARGMIGRDMFYLEEKLMTTTGIKDIVEENYLLLKHMIDGDLAEASLQCEHHETVCCSIWYTTLSESPSC